MNGEQGVKSADWRLSWTYGYDISKPNTASGESDDYSWTKIEEKMSDLEQGKLDGKTAWYTTTIQSKPVNRHSELLEETVCHRVVLAAPRSDERYPRG